MEKLKQIVVDQFPAVPCFGTIAAVNLSDLRDITSIVCMAGGLIVSILLAYHKIKTGKDDTE